MNFLQINNSNLTTIEQSLQEIAHLLFNDYSINVIGHFYRLLDIEFYYFWEGKFKDPYTHMNELQKNPQNSIFMNPVLISHLVQRKVMEEYC